MLLTSEARVHDDLSAPSGAEKIQLDMGSLALVVTPSDHQKCVRCWHYRADVGSNEEHPEICGRCVENVSGSGEIRRIG
jgi:isoleucyl-tRNA synthetase